MLNLQDKISQYDLIYDSPARSWIDGLAIGNGVMNALAYDADGAAPEWLVNHYALWDERSSEFKRLPMEQIRRIASGELDYVSELSKENPSGPRVAPMPVYGAQVRVESGRPAVYNAPHKITRHLHLFDGVLETKLDRHLSHPVINSFVCAGEDVMVIQVRNVSCMTSFGQCIKLFRDAQLEYDAPEFYTESDAVAFHQKIGTMEYSAALLVVSRPDQPLTYTEEFHKYVRSSTEPAPQMVGKATVVGSCAMIPATGNYDIFVSLEPGAAPAELIAKLRNVSACGSEKLLEKHTQYWNKFWERNQVTLDDPGLTQLWYLSNYHLAIAEGVNPAWGLCGPWFGRTPDPEQRLPWFGFYTNDYNAQVPVMPLPLINRPELAENTFRMIHGQLEQAKKNAKELFGIDGAYYPLSTGPDGREVSSGPYRFCMGSGPYWCCMIIRHYRYTGDVGFLKKYGYDVIREVSRFYAGYLEWEEADNCYHLRCSQNPELFYLDLPDPMDTLAFLKGTLQAGIFCSELFQCDEADRVKWQHILDHYPAYPTNKYGFSPLKGLSDNHINHSRTLAPVFPAEELDIEFPGGQLEDAKKELYNPTWQGFMHSRCCNDGWTEGWTGKVFHRGIPACRLGAKDLAWKYLCDLITGCVKPNGLIAHNMTQLVDTSLSEKNIEQLPDMDIEYQKGKFVSIAEVGCGRAEEDATEDWECKEKMYPVIEGPAIYLLLVGEMLMQGYHGLIRLFPALPDDRSASFKDLRAEGSLLVSAAKKDGVVQYVKIHALTSQTFMMLNPWEEGRSVYCNGEKIVPDHHHKFTLNAGEELILSIEPEYIEPEEAVEPAQARLILCDGCRGAFVGKPRPAEYYAGLEKIQKRRLI